MSKSENTEEAVASTHQPSSSTEEPLKVGQDVALSSKTAVNESNLSAPLQDSFARTSSTFSDVSTHSVNYDNERRGRLWVPGGGERYPSKSPAPLVLTESTWKNKFTTTWVRNKGLALVVLAQLFGVMMNVTTRLLEMDGAHGKGMHPFQILFARMTGTLVLSGAYQWYAKVEHAPFGPREVWTLLFARGFGGFFGVSLLKHGSLKSLEWPLME